MDQLESGSTMDSVALVGTNDSRLSDARTPKSHVHGNISNDGKIGTTTGLMVKTTTSGVLTTLAKGSSGQFLRYDGTWKTPPNTVYTHPSTHPYSMITGTPTSLPASGGHALSATHLLGDDTRAVNSAPSVYMSGGARYASRAGWQTEFKTRTAINSPPLSGTYVYLQTYTPWSDPSGGYPIQVVYGNGTPCWRVGVSTSAWSAWQSVNDNGNAEKLNGHTVSEFAFVNTQNIYSGEQKFQNSSYCPTAMDNASGVGCAYKASRGAVNQEIVGQIIAPCTAASDSNYSISNAANVIKFQRISSASAAAPTLADMGKVTSNGWEGGAVLSGTPTAPTASVGTNNTRIATTAFVQSTISALGNLASITVSASQPSGQPTGSFWFQVV